MQYTVNTPYDKNITILDTKWKVVRVESLYNIKRRSFNELRNIWLIIENTNQYFLIIKFLLKKSYKVHWESKMTFHHPFYNISPSPYQLEPNGRMIEYLSFPWCLSLPIWLIAKCWFSKCTLTLRELKDNYLSSSTYYVL